MSQEITIQTEINQPIAKVWEHWILPKHIKNWNTASDDWHTTKAENNLKVGGKFLYRMEAKDGSFSFDFEGTYSAVEKHQLISYILEDKRKVVTSFKIISTTKTKIITVFEAENENPKDIQQQGWQAILDNFKKYSASI